jgi:hypothetical protein
MGALQIGSDCDARTSVSQRVKPETMETMQDAAAFFRQRAGSSGQELGVPVQSAGMADHVMENSKWRFPLKCADR